MCVSEHSEQPSGAARPPPWRRLWEGVRTPMIACGSCLFAAERGRARRGTQHPASARVWRPRTLPALQSNCKHAACVMRSTYLGSQGICLIQEQRLRRILTRISGEGSFIMPNA